MVTIHIRPDLIPRSGMSAREWEHLAADLLEFFGQVDASVELRVTGDREIADLNQRFLGCPGPTNVLSFPVADSEGQAGGGSVALSLDALARECLLYGQPLREHLVRLLAHAFLHLSGLVHGPEMESLTEQAVETLGTG